MYRCKLGRNLIEGILDASILAIKSLADIIISFVTIHCILKRTRIFAPQCGGKKLSWTKLLQTSQLAWNFIWSGIGFCIRIGRLLRGKIDRIDIKLHA